MIAIGVKATLAMMAAFLLVASARRERASLRHLVLAALFLFLLMLPFVQRFAPSVDIAVKNATIAAATPAPIAEWRTNQAAATPSRSTMTASSFAWRAVHFYVAGAAILFAWLAIGIFRLRRLADTADVWLEGTRRMNEIALAANIRRPALVVLSGEVTVPLTFGFRRSTIVLPAAASAWSDEELTRALRHELEHVRREDWFLQLAARAACALYWPHPLVWIAWRRFCLEAERACDDAVVGTSSAEAYASQLVELARNVQRIRAVPALAMATRSKLALRVDAILDATQRRGPHGRSATLLACAVMLALLVSLAPARIIEAASEYDDAISDGIADGIRAVTQHSSSSVSTSYGGGELVEDTLCEALVKTAEAGEVQAVRELLDRGADVNCVKLGDGTALIGAARGGQMHMVDYLLERGADPNVTAPGDGSPLIAAARMGYVEIVTLLLNRGAEIDLMVTGDENALMQAAWNGHTDVVKRLIEEGADVHVRAYEQGELRTALRLARRGGHEHVVKMLLHAGARE